MISFIEEQKALPVGYAVSTGFFPAQVVEQVPEAASLPPGEGQSAGFFEESSDQPVLNGSGRRVKLATPQLWWSSRHLLSGLRIIAAYAFPL